MRYDRNIKINNYKKQRAILLLLGKMASPQPPVRAGQALPQEGGAKSLYSKPIPLLSWATLYTHPTCCIIRLFYKDISFPLLLSTWRES